MLIRKRSCARAGTRVVIERRPCSRIQSMKIRDVIKLVESDGWYLVGQEGSHRQYKHPLKKGHVTIPGKPGKDIARGTFKSVLNQAGLKSSE